MRNFSLSRLQSAFKFSYVVQKFKSMYSKCTAVRTLLESKANRPIREKVRPGQKIYYNMEKRLICSLTIIKPPSTIRAAAGKERVDATIVRRMLNGLAIRTFRKAKRFLIAKQNDARRKIWCSFIPKEILKCRFEAYDMNGWKLRCGQRIPQWSERKILRKKIWFDFGFQEISAWPRSHLCARRFLSPCGLDLVILPSGFKSTSATYN